MAGFEIRPAVPADKSAVLAINDDVYDGLDYLPAFYNFFVECPVETPYVAVYNGEIIGFVTAFLVDDNVTVVSRGGRVKAGYSGQGFYKRLKQRLLKASTARINAFTSYGGNKTITSSSFQKDNSLILSKPMMRYDFNVKSAHLNLKESDTTNTRILTRSLLELYITSGVHRDYLFPDNRLIVNWVPFKLLPSNLPIVWLMDEESLRLSDVRVEDNEMRGLMSIITTLFGQTGNLICHLDIYGRDCASVKQHVLSHLKFIQSRIAREATMLIFCDQFLVSGLEKTFADLDLVKSIWMSSGDSGNMFDVQWLYEKQLSIHLNL